MDTSGAEFPYSRTIDSEQFACGMSLRDWFAGQALAALGPAIRAAMETGEFKRNVAEVIAEAVFQAADAMLIERSRTTTETP